MKVHLWEIRKQKGLSLKQLSEMTQISTTHLNDVENDKKIPTVCVICRLSMALDVKPEELFDCNGCELESVRKF